MFIILYLTIANYDWIFIRVHGEVQFLYRERNNLLPQTNKMKRVLEYAVG